MKEKSKLLALIPARGGSKGLPGKNIRPFLGHPLVAHSILLARLCPEIDQIVVSTDDEKIAAVARQYDVEVPFLRPAELAQDDTPMWPVVRHALQTVETQNDQPFDFILLLDSTSPGRLPKDVSEALQRLQANPSADGIVGVSKPDFSPIWHSVIEKEGWMADLMPEGSNFHRRQDVPTVYRINASLYIWRTEFVRRCREDWRKTGRHLIYEIPESRAIHIDDLHEFEKAEVLARHGIINFPWV